MVDTRSSSRKKNRGRKSVSGLHRTEGANTMGICLEDVLQGIMGDGGVSFVIGAEDTGSDTDTAPPSARIKRRRRRGGEEDDDNPALGTYDAVHLSCYKRLSTGKRAQIAQHEREVSALACTDGSRVLPPRFRILESSASPSIKNSALARVDVLFRGDGPVGEKAKMSKWFEAFMRLPLGVLAPLPVSRESTNCEIRDFVNRTRRTLDECLYGHHEAKKQIIRTLAKWISNPQSRGAVIGIHGPPGCGKTTLVKNCIAEALGLPMVMIPLGGVSDSSVINGHLYTYEGSTYGAVAQCLMKAKCMNPVFLLDELDKIGGDSGRGQEVVNSLVHLTDPVQNEHFVDHYFADIPLDLSGSLMVLTFNDVDAINPILRDLMSLIETSGYSLTDKQRIAQAHILPRVCRQHGITTDMRITDEAVAEAVARVGSESGVRNLERAIESVVGNINLARITEETEIPGTIDLDTVVRFVEKEKGEDFSAKHIYL